MLNTLNLNLRWKEMNDMNKNDYSQSNQTSFKDFDEVYKELNSEQIRKLAYAGYTALIQTRGVDAQWEPAPTTTH